MSMHYWAITGYGIANIEELISEEKINTLYGDEESELDSNDYAYDLFEHSTYYFTDDGEGSYYFLYNPSMYFTMTDEEKAFTSSEDVAESMYDAIKDVLKDSVTRDDFVSKSEWISTYGAS